MPRLHPAVNGCCGEVTPRPPQGWSPAAKTSNGPSGGVWRKSWHTVILSVAKNLPCTRRFFAALRMTKSPSGMGRPLRGPRQTKWRPSAYNYDCRPVIFPPACPKEPSDATTRSVGLPDRGYCVCPYRPCRRRRRQTRRSRRSRSRRSRSRAAKAHQPKPSPSRRWSSSSPSAATTPKGPGRRACSAS